MNEQARDALVKHALLGTPKASWERQVGDAYCALGIIGLELLGNPQFMDFAAAGLSRQDAWCPFLGCAWLGPEAALVCHLNNLDGHDLDFLTIARKVGVPEEGPCAS